jgi:hypothetical protein
MSFLAELPSITGTRGRAVRAAYRVLAVVVIVLTLIGLGSMGRTRIWDEPAEAQYGFLVQSDPANRPILGHVWPEAMSAGAREGARVVGINGVALAPGATRFSVGRYARMAQPILGLDLAAADGHVTRVRLIRDAGGINRIIPDDGLGVIQSGIFDTANQVFCDFGILALSLLLFLRRPRDPEAMLLAFGFLLVALELRPIGWLVPSGSLASPGVVGWLSNVSYTAGTWCMLVGICAFPDGRFISRWSRVARLVPTAYLIINTATNYVLWTSALATSLLEIPITALVVGSLVIRYRPLPSGLQRQQIKCALFGGAVMVVAALIWTLVSAAPVQVVIGPAAVDIVSFLIGDVLQFAFPIGLLVSLLRYRLYDADTVIVRSASYGALSLALVAVFAGTEQIAQSIGQDQFGDRLGPLASGLGAAMAAVMIAPLHRRMTSWAERRFRAGLAKLRFDVPKMLDDARETATPAELGAAVLDRVIDSVHAKWGAVFLRDELVALRGLDAEDVEVWHNDLRSPTLSHPRQADPEDPTFPLRIALLTERSGLVGWLLLGSRPDGSFYGKDEQDALEEIAVQIASALVISELRRMRDADIAELRTEIGAVRRLVEELHLRSASA